jgi:HAD superfamily hydrolase (TIGR01549 family)
MVMKSVREPLITSGLRGIIFDMDGTLTIPVLDFDALREDLGMSGGDIAHYVRALPEPEQSVAWAVVEQHEIVAREQMQLQEGCLALLGRARAVGLKLGILTRNGPESVVPLLRHTGEIFDPVITREFSHVKPHPAPVYEILGAWGVRAGEVLVVGDYIHDVECGRAAGTKTCHFWNAGCVDYRAEADFWVRSMAELDVLLFGLDPDLPGE